MKKVFKIFPILFFVLSLFFSSCNNNVKMVSEPVFIPTFDTFIDTLKVEIAQDDGYEIYYKFDGQESWTLYTGPFVIDATSKLYAYAQTDEGRKSKKTEKFYTCYYGQVADVVCSQTKGENTIWFDGSMKLDLSCETTESAIYYTIDGSNPLTSPTRIKYNEQEGFLVNGECTIKVISEKPDWKSSRISTFKAKQQRYNSFLPIFDIVSTDYKRSPGKFINTISYKISLPDGNNLVNPKIYYYINGDKSEPIEYSQGVEFTLNANSASQNFIKDGEKLYLDVNAYVVSDDTKGTANTSHIRFEKISKVIAPTIRHKIINKDTDLGSSVVAMNNANMYFSAETQYVKVGAESEYTVKYILDGGEPVVYKNPLVISSTSVVDFYVEDDQHYSDDVKNAYISKVENIYNPSVVFSTDCGLGGMRFDQSCQFNIDLPQKAFDCVNPKVEYYFSDKPNTRQAIPYHYDDKKRKWVCNPINIGYLTASNFKSNTRVVEGDSSNQDVVNYYKNKDGMPYFDITVAFSADDLNNEKSQTFTIQKFNKVEQISFIDVDKDEYFIDKLDVKISNPSGKRVLYKLDNNTELEYNKVSIPITRTTTITAYVSDKNNYCDPIKETFTRDMFSLPEPKTWTNYNGDTIYQYSNIIYDSTYHGDGSTRFNLYSPVRITKDTLKKPFVVYVHGGSWNSGDPDEYEDFFERGWRRYADSYISKYGIPVLSIDYRHLGGGGGKLKAYVDYNALQPSDNSRPIINGHEEIDLGYYLFKDNGNRIMNQVKDVETFFTFVKNHCNTLRLDTSFAIMDGYSAGGNLELLYSLDGDYEKKIPIKAVIDRVGPADMSCRTYYDFFSSTLCNSRYTPDATVGLGLITFTITVYINFVNGQYDGEKLLTGMISAAVGANYNIGDINYVTSRGIDNAPRAIQEISPVWHAKNKRWNKGVYGEKGNYNRPYIVMAYGDNVSLSVALKGKNADQEPDASLSGDPLAPRRGGDALAIAYDTNGLLTHDGTTVTRNQNKHSLLNTYRTAYYFGDYTKGHYMTFIGSYRGGHDVSSTDSDTAFMKHWSSDELRWLREGVDYALQTVCGIKVGQYK